MLFDAGAKINVRANGQTLLSRAICNGHDAIIDELLERGIDLGQSTGGGASPLFLAASTGNTSLVRRLHAAGAAVDTVDANGNSALENAARLGELASVELLIDLKADIFTTDKQGASVAFGTITSGMCTSLQGHEACVRLLHVRSVWRQTARTPTCMNPCLSHCESNVRAHARRRVDLTSRRQTTTGGRPHTPSCNSRTCTGCGYFTLSVCRSMKRV